MNHHLRLFGFFTQPQNIIRLLEWSNNNGIIYCKVQRDIQTNIRGHEFDLVNRRYHLLVASGSSLNGNINSLTHNHDQFDLNLFSIAKQPIVLATMTSVASHRHHHRIWPKFRHSLVAPSCSCACTPPLCWSRGSVPPQSVSSWPDTSNRHGWAVNHAARINGLP